MKNFYKNFDLILKEELVPAQGCTEPIAIAYAAAYAKEVLNALPKTITVYCSGNIIKNVKSVVVPNSNNMCGIQASALLGAFGGKSSLGMQVLSQITPEQIKLANEMNNQNICIVKHLETCHNLHIIVEMSDENNCVTVEVLNLHDNIVKVIKNNKILLNKESDDSKFYGTFTSREQLSFDNIYDYAKNADLSNIIDLIKMQKDFNYAIAVEGMKGNYGIAIGITNINHYPDNIYTKMKAYALAASEARMCGCKLPVVTNSGSGNQGIGASVPLILYAKYNKISDEDLDRALVFSNLLTIYQKTFIGRLSAFCGAISATCGAVCGLAFLQNYDKQVLRNVIINTLANDIGVICDGAKSSCAAKIGCGFDAAINAYFLAIDGKRYPDKCGIINEDVDITIKNVGRMASKGMQDTDREILQIMLEN